MDEQKRVTMYADGACIGNPGPGGYGVVLRHGDRRRELSGGVRLTTNNRMELLGVIAGPEAIMEPCAVTVYSDSQYVVEAMTKGWAARWRTNGWLLSAKARALNTDLWGRLLALCARHEVAFVWVKGHAGNAENERCDALAIWAARQRDLPADAAYESGEAQRRTPPSLVD